jgi:protein gp37
MANGTSIEWTDASWNPLRAKNRETGKVGWYCSHISPGCGDQSGGGCYAEAINRRLGTHIDYRSQDLGKVETFLDEKMLIQPLRWQKPRKIFVCSMSDLFGDWVEDQDLDEIHAVMALARYHTFQVLTKRPERMREYYKSPTLAKRIFLEITKYAEPRPDDFCDWMLMNQSAMEQHHENIQAIRDNRKPHYLPEDMILELPLPNVWLGVSVEDQRRADERIPLLLDTLATVRWISAEPLLSDVDLSAHLDYSPSLNWVVVGGESGPDARVFDIGWARSIISQCKMAGVACFVKQLGARPHKWLRDHPKGLPACETFLPLCLKDRKGGNPEEWPAELRVREYPDTHL